VHGARENGIDAIAVTYGYGSREELQAAEPTSLATSVDELRLLLFAV
jgi:phosphoglycolate phosphatase